nr:MAG TPA: hypothetical protein [Bacteriophage sp.]
MIMTREEFVKKCNDVVRNYRNVEEFNKCINQTLDSGCIDLDKVPQNYIPAFWVVGALFQRSANQCVNGSVCEETRRRDRREAKNIAKFIPWWFL